MVNPTLYDILGVSPDASRDEIKRAWRDAADRFEPGSGGSSAQFRLFNEAAEVLLDPARRKAYDEQLTEQAPADPTPEPAVAAAPAPAAPPDTAGRDISLTHEETTKTRGTRGGVPIAVLVVLGLLAAAAVGVAIYLGTQYQRATAHENALDQAPSAAERAATAVLSYDYKSLDADRDAASKFLTSGYRDDYVDTFDSLVQDSAKKTSAKVEAKVLASSAMPQTGDRDPDRIPVLLFVNQTTLSTANSGEPSLALNRVRLDMVNVDGTWLVDGITSY